MKRSEEMLLTVVVMVLIVYGESFKPQNRIGNPNPVEAGDSKSFTSMNTKLISVRCYNICTSSEYRNYSFGPVIANFSAESIDSCKMYCWYHKTCRSFTVDFQSSTCSLYYNFPFLTEPSLDAKHCSFDVIGDIECLKNYERSPSVPCRTIESTLKTSEDLGGVLIQDVYSRQCLGFGRRSIEIKWIDCTNGITWKLKKITNRTEYETKMKLLQSDSPGNCLEVRKDNTTMQDGIVVDTVATCQDDNEDQLFEIASGTFYSLINRVDSAENDNNCFFSIMSNKTYITLASSSVYLNTLTFLLPVEHLALCKRNKIKIPNGQVESKLPFYLPGSNISVRCKPGYGFKEFDFHPALNITCQNEKKRGLKCDKLDAKPSENPPLITIFGWCFVGGALLICFLVALAKKIRASKADHSPAEENS